MALLMCLLRLKECPQLSSVIFPSYNTCLSDLLIFIIRPVRRKFVSSIASKNLASFKIASTFFKKFAVLTFVFNIVMHLRLFVNLMLTVN